jgi:DNA-binding beta-propeller fold protein YncE
MTPSTARIFFIGLAAIALLLAVAAGVKWLRHHSGECTNQSQSLPLRSVVDVAVQAWRPTPKGKMPRMDYQVVDSARHTLYVAYPDDNEILVVNLEQNKIVGSINDLRSVHGVLLIPELHRLYAATSGLDQIATIDQESLKITDRTAVGSNPDGIAYDPRDRKIFVSDSHATGDTVIDATTNRKVGTIDVGGEPGNTQYDAASGRVYVAVGTRNDLVAIDPRTNKVVARYELPGCNHDHGLLLDTAHRLAFVACARNARLVVLDMKTWKEKSTFPVGVNPDIMAFDAGLGRLYVASESGDLAVFDEKGGWMQPLGVGCLAYEAHTVAVDPKTHRVYFALHDVGGQPIVRVMEPTNVKL